MQVEGEGDPEGDVKMEVEGAPRGRVLARAPVPVVARARGCQMVCVREGSLIEGVHCEHD